MKRIYLDYAATTPTHPEVVQAMLPYFTEVFGNPSSIYSYGQEAKEAVEEARAKIAKFIGARDEDRITFVGLPAKAVIRIFTGHGNLVKTLNHPNPENRSSVPESADEAWYQISDSQQTIKSGVYFYHVEGWDRFGNSVGTTQGKFIIIR